MLKLVTLAADQDTRFLREQLEQAGVDFQIRENHQHNVLELWVADNHLDNAARILNALQAPIKEETYKTPLDKIWPITLITILLGFMGYAVETWRPQWSSLLSFTEIRVFFDYPIISSFKETFIEKGELWRLITPAFLHFGIWHILFNALSLWDLGRRLEFVMSPLQYLAVLLTTGVVANVVQYTISEASRFGGLSGVVCGLFGVQWMLYRRSSLAVLKMTKGVYLWVFICLVILPLVLEKTFGVRIANGAHFGGLFAGILFGWLIPLNKLNPRAHTISSV